MIPLECSWISTADENHWDTACYDMKTGKVRRSTMFRYENETIDMAEARANMTCILPPRREESDTEWKDIRSGLGTSPWKVIQEVGVLWHLIAQYNSHWVESCVHRKINETLEQAEARVNGKLFEEGAK